MVDLMKEWMDHNGFEDFQLVQYGSLFYPISTHKKLRTISDLPQNMSERFKKLFESLLTRGIYIAPNGYEVGFVSLAHDENIQAELHRRLWT
jgi:glutamate-1-semialdehyde 2,1-aminomutase